MIWNAKYVLSNLDSANKYLAFTECSSKAFGPNGIFLFIENITIVVGSDCTCMNE